MMEIDPRRDSTWTKRDDDAFQEALALAQEARERVEQHDPQTHDHGVRVAQWAVMLASRLPGFGLRRLRRLEISALLHDYGKLVIPASILNKPGPLDEHEWSLIRHHPEVGALSAPVNPEFVDRAAILWHHKAFDGGGYPGGGPAGLAIPIEARITAVADVFDAITSPRSYHPGGKGLDPDGAVHLLRELAGSLLDPMLVNLFEAMCAETRECLGPGVRPGMQTLSVRWVLTNEVERARKYIEREIGPFDPERPLGGRPPPKGLVERLVAKMVRVNLDADSARNVVMYALGLPLMETFGPGDLVMDDAERRDAETRAGNHMEAMIYVRADHPRLRYMSVVVFAGNLWLCVGEKTGDRTAVWLIR